MSFLKRVVFFFFLGQVFSLKDGPNFYSLLQTASSSSSSSSNPSTIQGKIKLNDVLYSTICDCAPGTFEDHPELSQCDPSQLKIHQDKQGDGASFEEIRTFIGPPSSLTFVSIEQSSFSCLDGRSSSPSLSTPGGDIGEFLLSLHVYENMIDRPLSYTAIKEDLNLYLSSMTHPYFTMCTDDSAMNHLELDSGVQINIEILRKPPEANKEELLRYLISPENVGCTHLKKILKNPEYYSIRKELIQSLITAFYEILWDKDSSTIQTDEHRKNNIAESNTNSNLQKKLKLEGLVGARQETAFIEVRMNEACGKAGIAPLIAGRSQDRKLSVFVNHIEAVGVRRKQLAKFFVEQVNRHQEPIEWETLYNRMNKHGLAFLEVTGSYVAKNLPFFTLNFV